MRKTYTFLKAYILALTLLVVTIIIIQSCNKQSELLTQADAISTAKNWFNQQKIKLYTPDWSSSKILIIDKEKFIVLPTTISYSSKEIISSTLLINVSAVHITGYIAEFINSVPPTDEPGLIRAYKAMMNRNAIGLADTFEGNALLFTVGHDFIDGWHTFKGKLVGWISENPKTLKDRLKMTIDHDATECYQYYWVERDAYTGEVLDSTYLYTMCDTAGGGSDGGTGGSGTGSINNPPNKEIIDSVKNACIKNALTLALAKNAVNEIKTLFYNAFGSSKDYNVVFIDGSLASTTKDATTSTVPIKGVMTSTITFNTDVAGIRSEQYAVATIYHEMVHTELRKLFPESSLGKILVPPQHDYMAQNFVDKIKTSLKSVFPNLSDTDAWALSWGGLKQTSFFDLLTDANKTLIGETLMKYSDKDRYDKLGTYCNN
ncbi:hypothetical protein [Pedobacter borealis]|uniref:hypothetical protein n=1 Tax=Pedobacter borealis TaxID=475254 RepID=UPI000493499F|nr:hypothetical protein [Pedobacter borealis]